MSKLAKNDLLSIYKLEFYKRKKKWIIPTKSNKGGKKDKKVVEKKISEGKIVEELEEAKCSRDPDLVIDESELKDFNRTYSVETSSNKSTWNNAFIVSGVDIGTENEDDEIPKINIDKSEPVINTKNYWPQLMLSGITNFEDINDSNDCFNPLSYSDYQDGDKAMHILKTNDPKVDINSNIEKEQQNNDLKSIHLYDSGDNEFVNEKIVQNCNLISKNVNLAVKNKNLMTKNENSIAKDEIDNKNVRHAFQQPVENEIQYGNGFTNEGMYYENNCGFYSETSNEIYENQEQVVVTDENYLQHVLMQINNEVTSAEGRLSDDIGSCSSINTLQFMEGAKHAPHSSEIDLFVAGMSKEQMCMNDRNTMEKYNEILHEEKLLSQKFNIKKNHQHSNSYLWNNINNGDKKAQNDTIRPPTASTIISKTNPHDNYNIDATNHLSKLLLGDNETSQYPQDMSKIENNVNPKINKESEENETPLYPKFPKISLKNSENMKNYSMPSDINHDFPVFTNSSDRLSFSCRQYAAEELLCYDESEDLSSKNLYAFLDNTKNTICTNDANEFTKCLPNFNSVSSLNSCMTGLNSTVQNLNQNAPNYDTDKFYYIAKNAAYPDSCPSSVYSENIKKPALQMPNVNIAQPNLESNVPFNRNVPNLNRNMPNLITTLQELNRNVPNGNSNILNSNLNIPNINQNMSNINPNIPNINPNMPNINQNMPNINPNIRNMPNINPNMSNINQNMPNINPNMPNINPNMPNINSNRANINPNMPNINPNMPNKNPTLSVLNNCVPNSNTGTQDAEIPLPNFSVPPPNLMPCSDCDNFVKNSISYVDLQGVNLRWSSNDAQQNYMEIQNPGSRGPPGMTKCFFAMAPKGRGRGRLMKS